MLAVITGTTRVVLGVGYRESYVSITVWGAGPRSLIWPKSSCPTATVSCALFQVFEKRARLLAPASSSTYTYRKILADATVASYFCDCIGVLDGTLIPVRVPADVSYAWRSGSAEICQNVLVVVNFDMTLSYLQVESNGSMRVLAFSPGQVLSGRRRVCLEVILHYAL